ncbi:RapZ C-terminal domain-containing protein [Streptomyces anulatus]
MTIRIVSFGYGHEAPPVAEFTYDLRAQLRNPFSDPALKHLTGLDQPVYDHVLDTPGAERWAFNAVAQALGLIEDTGADNIVIAWGCVGGRHRSVGLARRSHEILTAAGHDVVLEHRDVEKPLLPAGVHNRSTYTPTDVTPPELLPEALAQQVPAWAEAAATPADVTDWADRQARALVRFELDADGWPMHPQGRTGRVGRNLGLWGENQAADPIVVAGYGQERRVLLITRSDIEQEAIPGGMVDAHLGETAPAALVRELQEETGVDLRDHTPVILGRDLVDDWRASDHAWVSSTSALYQLPTTVTAIGADDALDATWYPFGDLDQLTAAIEAAGRTLYAAHVPLLTRALDYLGLSGESVLASTDMLMVDLDGGRGGPLPGDIV